MLVPVYTCVCYSHLLYFTAKYGKFSYYPLNRRIGYLEYVVISSIVLGYHPQYNDSKSDSRLDTAMLQSCVVCGCLKFVTGLCIAGILRQLCLLDLEHRGAAQVEVRLGVVIRRGHVVSSRDTVRGWHVIVHIKPVRTYLGIQGLLWAPGPFRFAASRSHGSLRGPPCINVKRTRRVKRC